MSKKYRIYKTNSRNNKFFIYISH